MKWSHFILILVLAALIPSAAVATPGDTNVVIGTPEMVVGQPAPQKNLDWKPVVGTLSNEAISRPPTKNDQQFRTAQAGPPEYYELLKWEVKYAQPQLGGGILTLVSLRYDGKGSPATVQIGYDYGEDAGCCIIISPYIVEVDLQDGREHVIPFQGDPMAPLLPKWFYFRFVNGPWLAWTSWAPEDCLDGPTFSLKYRSSTEAQVRVDNTSNQRLNVAYRYQGQGRMLARGDDLEFSPELQLGNGAEFIHVWNQLRYTPIFRTPLFCGTLHWHSPALR